MRAALQDADTSRTLACKLRKLKYLRENIGWAVRRKRGPLLAESAKMRYMVRVRIVLNGLISMRHETLAADRRE